VVAGDRYTIPSTIREAPVGSGDYDLHRRDPQLPLCANSGHSILSICASVLTVGSAHAWPRIVRPGSVSTTFQRASLQLADGVADCVRRSRPPCRAQAGAWRRLASSERRSMSIRKSRPSARTQPPNDRHSRGSGGLALESAPLLDMLPSHRLALPPHEFDKPRLRGPDYLVIERRD
jgi:hypothetical protein